MKKYLVIAAIAAFLAVRAGAHCEIPCGIYDDQTRFKLLNEHIDTIAKSIHEIGHLSEDGAKQNYNQLVRWVVNKETHASEFQQIVTQYFMTQRVKPVAPDAPGYNHYVAQLTVLHQMLVEAMKAKQSADPATVKKLRELTAQFEKLYQESMRSR